ncbi:hypothetical protein Tcan_10017 [Toxocara canis]|uniref:Secreted protein n=1 Tax=Toxocara canis TaxID=6265 RepID=A0A0B2W1H1_TOXCA|nr:hypothetical protein Tcan_10017 [Toxocara canis]
MQLWLPIASLTFVLMMVVFPFLIAPLEAYSLCSSWRSGCSLKRYSSAISSSISLRPGRPLKRSLGGRHLEASNDAYLNLPEVTPWFGLAKPSAVDDEHTRNVVNKRANANKNSILWLM